MVRAPFPAVMVSQRLARLTPNQVRLALGLLAAAAAFACALVFAKFAESVWRGERAVMADEAVMGWVLGHRWGPVTDVMRLVTNLAGPRVVSAVVAGVVVVSLWRGRPRLAVFMVAATAGAGLLVALVKLLVGRPRPVVSDRLIGVTGAAFPSGHAAQSVACWVALAVVVAWVVGKRWVTVGALVLAILMAAVVGGSRVYLGVHWPSDVIAGWALALTWVAGLLAAIALWDATTRRCVGHPLPDSLLPDPAPRQQGEPGWRG
jgi:undecaprenyl-diphosphatase